MIPEKINPFDTAIEWVVFNPTPFKIEGRFDGFDVVVDKFGTFKTPHKRVHDFLINDVNNKDRGLVSYTYTNEMKLIYKTEKEFQKAKALEGMFALQDHLERLVHWENTALQQNKIQKVPGFLKSKIKDFEKDQKAINELIVKFQEGPKDESGADQDTGEKKAGRRKSESVE